MASPEDDTILELSTAEKLDDEITKLRAQVDSLKRDLHLHTSTLITSPPIPSAIQDDQQLATHAAEQEAHKQQCLYRTCASITTFRVQDPDPQAVDAGRVLGLRIEVMAKARFVRPYFVMLNRPWGAHARSFLRVHRHTVPACVPLSGLAARYLPPPLIKRTAAEEDADADADDDGEEEDDSRRRRAAAKGKQQQKQDLPRFARALRRELVRYHNRVAVIGDLRKAAGLEGKRRKSKEVMDPPIVDVSAADAEAKQIRIEWGDGKSGRLVMSDDGEILKMVVQKGAMGGGQGQDRETVRQFLGGAVRIEEISRHF
ncbi:putative cenp-o kinetochore centromere component protein [Eutypa lata UCREL1]|uniref:Putative cenp-o kinetochore centromere component protein n=1 Tax=Eutypa lata (strain UCR-EL1) TaxID=1287681 RepID=M7SWQ4_EUTLA|nr:putative cenp-o kinetochore centromere component protein [Eutypa lata UCREL1]